MKHTPSALLLRALAQPTRPLCHLRTMHTTHALLSDAPKPTKPREDDILRTPEMRHIRSKSGELQPKPLSKPLGLPFPPRAGDNSPRERFNFKDFASYEKHIAARREILKDVFERNYYRDIGNLGKLHRGKSILAPATPFRANVAMYFPNLSGVTLAQPWSSQDTVGVTQNRITVVSVLNTEWANQQVQTFVSQKANPALHEFMASPPARAAGAAFVTINVEPNHLKRLLVRTFFWNLRRKLPKAEHDKYFLLPAAIPEEIRDALAMWNSKVGYVYLLDQHSRVRWAGNGDARPNEQQSLVNCLKRLCEESERNKQASVADLALRREEPKPTKKLAQKA